MVVAVACTEETLPKEQRVSHSSHSSQSLHSSQSAKSQSTAALEESLLHEVSSPLLTEELVIPPKSSPLRESLLTRDAILLMVAYGRRGGSLSLAAMISLVSFAFLTIFSVAITSPIPHYGMSLDSEQASLLSSAGSPFQLALTLLIPLLDKLVLYKSIFGFSMLLSSVLPLLYPLLCETVNLPATVSV